MKRDKYIFDGWLVDNELNRLIKNEEIKLEPKVMEVLLCLIRHQGKTVSKDFLIKEIWQDVVVVEKSINRTISILRKSLNDNAKEPRYIETISKKGYRFIFPVDIVGDIEISNPSEPPVPKPGPRTPKITEPTKRKTRIWVAASVLIAIIISTIIYTINSNSEMDNWATGPIPNVGTFFQTPSGSDIAVDKNGNVYVSNATAEIRKIKKDGSSDSVFLSGSSLARATGLAFDPDGKVLYVSCRPFRKSGWITKIYPDGSDEILVKDLDGPGDITVDLDGNLYVSELMGNITKITPAGIATNYISLPSVNTPLGIAWSPGDTLYVSSAHDGNIYKIVPGTKPTVKYFAHVDGVEEKWGCGFMIYLSGYLYITNGNNRVLRISKRGKVTYFAGTGEPGWIDGPADIAQFKAPNGICANEDGSRIYVTEWHRNRVRFIENFKSKY